MRKIRKQDIAAGDLADGSLRAMLPERYHDLFLSLLKSFDFPKLSAAEQILAEQIAFARCKLAEATKDTKSLETITKWQNQLINLVRPFTALRKAAEQPAAKETDLMTLLNGITPIGQA